MSGSYFIMGSNSEKCGIFLKNSRFFRADMAGLGKYHMGRYGRIGVYRVKDILKLCFTLAKKAYLLINAWLILESTFPVLPINHCKGGRWCLCFRWILC